MIRQRTSESARRDLHAAWGTYSSVAYGIVDQYRDTRHIQLHTDYQVWRCFNYIMVHFKLLVHHDTNPGYTGIQITYRDRLQTDYIQNISYIWITYNLHMITYGLYTLFIVIRSGLHTQHINCMLLTYRLHSTPCIQITYRSQITYKLHTDYMHNTSYILITYNLHVNDILVTCSLPTDYIQITCMIHTTYQLHTMQIDYIPLTYRLHTGYIQIT